MEILGRLMKKDIEPQENLKEDLKAVMASKKNKSVAVEYVIKDGSRNVVLVNSKAQIALCYDNRDQLNMETRMIWGTESEYSDFINTAAEMSREVDTNRYHIFANAFTHSPKFIDYIDIIYKDYSFQKLVELNRHYDEDRVKERNIVEIPVNDASKLSFLNQPIDKAFEEVDIIISREEKAIEKIGLDPEDVFTLEVSNAIGLDDQEDTDKVLIGAADAEGQTVEDIKNKSTGFLFADIIERLSRANERGWIKLSWGNGEAIESFNSKPKALPEYSANENEYEIEGLDSSLEDNEFVDGMLDKYTDDNDYSVDDQEFEIEETNDTDYSEIETLVIDTDQENNEYIGDDFMNNTDQLEQDNDSNENEEVSEFDTNSLLSEESTMEEIEEVLFEDETDDLNEEEVESLFDEYEDNAVEEEKVTEEVNSEDDTEHSPLVEDESSVVNVDEDIHYEIEGNEKAEEMPVFLDEEPHDEDFYDVSIPEKENHVNNGFKERRDISLPDTDEISLISSAYFEDFYDNLSDTPVTPEGTFKSLGIDTNDFSSIFEDLIKEKQNASERLQRIPEMISSHQEELTYLHASLDESEQDIDELEEELEKMRIKRDEVIFEYDRVSGELDDKSAQAVKRKHRIRQISILLEKMETEQEFYSNTLESAEKALEKAKKTNPQTVASFTDVLDRIQNGETDEELLLEEDELVSDVDFVTEDTNIDSFEEEDFAGLTESSEEFSEKEKHGKYEGLDSDQIHMLENEGGGVIPASRVDRNKFRGDFIDFDSSEDTFEDKSNT